MVSVQLFQDQNVCQLMYSTFTFRVAEFLLVPPPDDEPLSMQTTQTQTQPEKSSFTLSESSSSLHDVHMSSAGPSAGPSRSSSTPRLSQAISAPAMGLEEPMDEYTSDLFAIARCYYDSKEHERVDHLLRSVAHPKARFLGLYSRFLVSQGPVIRSTSGPISFLQQSLGE